jgi:hypothetical protein
MARPSAWSLFKKDGRKLWLRTGQTTPEIHRATGASFHVNARSLEQEATAPGEIRYAFAGQSSYDTL